MQKTKTKLNSIGFTSGHAQLITVAVAIFASLMFIKSDLKLSAIFANADDEVAMLTYDDVKNQVTSEFGYTTPSSDVDEDIIAQLELLDRGGMDGSVLGEAIGIGAIPDADDLILPEINSQIYLTVLPVSQDTEYARAQYQIVTQAIETDANIVALLGGLNSSDQESLRHSVKGWEWVINTLSSTPVPPSLEKFHHSKIVYYSVMMNIGKVYAGDKKDTDLQLLTKAMLSYSQKVETLKSQMNAQYRLGL